MANQSLGQAVAARQSRAAEAALNHKLARARGFYAPRVRRLNAESAVRRSLAGAKGLRP